MTASFEILREIFDNCKDDWFSFAKSAEKETHFAKTLKEFKKRPTPSYDYFSRAPEAQTPPYRVELARSGRSSCVATGIGRKCEDASIHKGEIRIGRFLSQVGSFGGWKHLACWRVPMSIWLGLPSPEDYSDQPLMFDKALLTMNEVSLSGYSDLNQDDRYQIARHVMNPGNWARATKLRTSPAVVTYEGWSQPGQQSPSSSSTSSSVLVPTTTSTTTPLPLPTPGVDATADALSGKSFHLTGRFPEVGGGSGLREGKKRTKELLESFGGRVVSKLSGKTDILVVGEEPGFKTVSSARKKHIPLLNLSDLVAEGIMEDNLPALEASATTTPLVIQTFSPGYLGRQVQELQSVTPEQYALAAGTAADTTTGSTSPNKKTLALANVPSASTSVVKKRKLASISETQLENKDARTKPPATTTVSRRATRSNSMNKKPTMRMKTRAMMKN